MKLRQVLARVVFMGVAASQNGCCCPEGDPAIDVDFDRTTPDIAALIDRCEADPNDCHELCVAALRHEFGDDAAFYQVTDCDVTPTADGAHVHAFYWDGSACGRAPDGLAPCTADLGDPVAHWLARAAYLEAASVIAFTHLAADLIRHGAPRVLVEAAIAAARDEIRHAAMLRELLSVPVPVARIAAYRPSSLRDLAMRNAIEGCARETIGAAINLWQAQRARDPQLRATFASIARDEVAHAELAWAIHTWATHQLEARDAAEISAARTTALDDIVDGLATDSATRDALGLPDEHETRALVIAIARDLTIVAT